MRPTSYIALTLGPSVSRYATSQQYVTALRRPGRDGLLRPAIRDVRSPAGRFRAQYRSMSPSPRRSPWNSWCSRSSRARIVDSVQGISTHRGPSPRASTGWTAAPSRRSWTGTAPSPGTSSTPTARGRRRSQLTNPDFSYRSLRGNAVLRWEYRRDRQSTSSGTQSRDQSTPFEEGTGIGPSWRGPWRREAGDIRLLKFNYWLSF